ncbi:hypothetical protein [Flavobacterium sp. RS13.1]|uniref:hypothetical protein n=1 Tax=Flavobacterium sp. RS13.1 TaxID=3400345 RepID=UPI003AABC720
MKKLSSFSLAMTYLIGFTSCSYNTTPLSESQLTNVNTNKITPIEGTPLKPKISIIRLENFPA